MSTSKFKSLTCESVHTQTPSSLRNVRALVCVLLLPPKGVGRPKASPTRSCKRGKSYKGGQPPNHPARLSLVVLDASTRRYRHRCASSVAQLMDAIARGVEVRVTRQPPRWGTPPPQRGQQNTRGLVSQGSVFRGSNREVLQGCTCVRSANRQTTLKQTKQVLFCYGER